MHNCCFSLLNMEQNGAMNKPLSHTHTHTTTSIYFKGGKVATEFTLH